MRLRCPGAKQHPQTTADQHIINTPSKVVVTRTDAVTSQQIFSYRVRDEHETLDNESPPLNIRRNTRRFISTRILQTAVQDCTNRGAADDKAVRRKAPTHTQKTIALKLRLRCRLQARTPQQHML